jgi:hypothetical protein
MKPRFKFGYSVSYTLAPAISYAMRADFTFRIGVVDEYAQDTGRGYTQQWQEFDPRAEVTFVSFAETPEEAISRYTDTYCLHPSVLPIRFNPIFAAGYNQGIQARIGDLIFTETSAGSLMMGTCYRWYQTPAILEFLGKCFDYPDDNMSFAASKKFDAVRDQWDRMDAMARFWYCLHMRGARLGVVNPQTGAWEQVPAKEQIDADRLSLMLIDTKLKCDTLKAQVEPAKV